MDHSRSESTLHAAPRGEHRFAGLLVSAVLGAYRLSISPMLGPSCRFEPSCSRYAEQAIARHGAWRGGMMALRRLLRCHPWGGAGGFDPVS